MKLALALCHLDYVAKTQYCSPGKNGLFVLYYNLQSIYNTYLFKYDQSGQYVPK